MCIRDRDISSFVQAGQIPLATFFELNPDGSDKGLSLGFRPEQLNLRAYSYTSAQRPGVRVRELIQGNDVGIAYWRFSDAYHMQSGNNPNGGDLPGDFKFFYGATVIRDSELKEGVFAIYGSGWVLAKDAICPRECILLRSREAGSWTILSMSRTLFVT